VKHVTLSPAKVNLFLKVLSKRPDGYHNIISIVDIVSLCDVIRIEETSRNAISLTDSKGALPDGPGNTIYRAIAALKDRYGIRTGVRVHVEKNIPIGSGLGGPSSNAATALKAMARIWNLPVREEELHEIGRAVGADVPLFLYGKPCVMKGIGDLISPIHLPIMWYVIVYPAVSIQTKAVYEGLKIVLTKKENDITLLGKFDAAREICAILENDLEKVGTVICPAIQVIKDRLIDAGSIGTLMSGSGSSVFGIFESATKAREASASLAGMGNVFVVRSVGEDGHYGAYEHQEVSCT
jgi:4-diphosphocytidyl-2-C-methyl-D-erythritol kinase